MTQPQPTPGPSPQAAPPPPGTVNTTDPNSGTPSPYTVPPATAGTTSTSPSSWQWSDGQWGLGSLATDTIVWGGIPQPGQADVTGNKRFETGQFQQANDVNQDGGWNPLAHSTVLQATNYFMGQYASNRAEFNGIREALANAGYYGSSNIAQIVNRAAGTWDTDALHKAMLDYTGWTTQTGSPMTFVEWLQGEEKNPNLAGNSAPSSAYGGGKPGGVGTVSLTDPAQLAMYAQRAARASLGRELTPDQLNQFIDSFHGEEQQNQTAAMTGAPKVNASDARSESIQYVENQFGTEMEQHQAKGYMNALLNLFLPGADQRANINTDPNAVSY